MVHISHDDIGALLTNPSADVRVMTARRTAAEFARPTLTPTERNLAIDLFRMLARDPDDEVRRALAEAIKDEPLVPHDVIQVLALDGVEVATPVLEHSIVLPDEDLIEVVRSRGAGHRIAVARRGQISPTLAAALADTRAEPIVFTMLRNPGAEVSPATYDTIARAFPATSPVLGAAADHRLAAILRSASRHPSMPAFLAERLVHRVAEKVAAELGAIDHLPSSAVDRLVAHSRERATVALLRHGAAEQNATLARQLARAGRLTGAILARACFEGHMDFVVAALAHAADRPEGGIAAAFKRHQSKVLADILKAARLPKGAMEALIVMLKAARANKYQGGLKGLEAFQGATLIDASAHDAEDFFDRFDVAGRASAGPSAKPGPRAPRTT